MEVVEEEEVSNRSHRWHYEVKKFCEDFRVTEVETTVAGGVGPPVTFEGPDADIVIAVGGSKSGRSSGGAQATEDVVRETPEEMAVALGAETMASLAELDAAFRANWRKGKVCSAANFPLSSVRLPCPAAKTQRATIHLRVRTLFPFLQTKVAEGGTVIEVVPGEELRPLVNCLSEERAEALAAFLARGEGDPSARAGVRLTGSAVKGTANSESSGGSSSSSSSSTGGGGGGGGGSSNAKGDGDRTDRKTRTLVHGLLRAHYRSLSSDTGRDGEVYASWRRVGRISARGQRSRGKRGRKRKRGEREVAGGGNTEAQGFDDGVDDEANAIGERRQGHLSFVVEKVNVEHSHMISVLSRALRVSPAALSFRGTKDKRGVTLQAVAVDIGKMRLGGGIVPRGGEEEGGGGGGAIGSGSGGVEGEGEGAGAIGLALARIRAVRQSGNILCEDDGVGSVRVGRILGITRGPLQLGRAWGNEFSVVLRDVRKVGSRKEATTLTGEGAREKEGGGEGNKEIVSLPSEEALSLRVKEISTRGALNLYGEQRLGRGRGNCNPCSPQAIGLHLIQRDFARAVTLLVTGSADGITPPPPPPEPNDSASFAPSAAAAMAWMARRNFAHDGDTKSALKALPRSMVKERAVIKGLGKAWQKRKIMMSAETAQTEEGSGGKVGGKGWAAALEDEDAASALMGLPLRDRTFYAHAYQSKLFNEIALERERLGEMAAASAAMSGGGAGSGIGGEGLFLAPGVLHGDLIRCKDAPHGIAVATPAFIATEIAKQKKRDEARGTSAPLPPAESLAARVVVPMVGSRTVHIIERAEAATASKSGAAAVGDVGHMHPASSRAILARLARDHLKPTNFEATSVLAARAATSAAAAAGGGRAAAAAAAVTATVAAVLPTVLPTLRGTMNRRLRLFPRGLSAHLLPRPGPAPGLTSMASNKLASEGRDVQLKFALPSGAYATELIAQFMRDL